MSVPSFDEVPSDFISTNQDGTPQRPAAEPYLHPIAVLFHLLFKVSAYTFAMGDLAHLTQGTLRAGHDECDLVIRAR